MPGEVVFDIETIGDIRDYSTMKITVVSYYDYAAEKYISLEEEELGQLWPVFENAERIIGYNSEHFDLPILNRYYPGDIFRFPHLDLLKVIRENCGKRYKLDDIAQATLQEKKSADGLQAAKWFEAGEVQKVKDYCEQDVKVTKGVYEFGRKNRMLYYPTLTGEIMPIPVNFDPIPQEKREEVGSGVNLTLPI